MYTLNTLPSNAYPEHHGYVLERYGPDILAHGCNCHC
jgi:hypothetical protein